MKELNFLDSLFGDLLESSTTRSATYSYPRVDVIEKNNAYTLEMELPGRSEDDVNIELNQDNLTISSKNEKKVENKNETKTEKYLLRERRYNDFCRRFTLPQDVDTESIKANFKNGVLTIFMTKKAEMSPKTIKIEAC